MTPPFLAYYGVAKRNITIAKEAFTQIAAYRDILRDPASNLWMHIKGGTWEDPKRWGTGMGWAVAGMIRVYATYHFSPLIGTFDAERLQLAAWANEIVTAVLPWIVSNSAKLRRHTSSPLFASQTMTSCQMSTLTIAASMILQARPLLRLLSTAWRSCVSWMTQARLLQRLNSFVAASMPS